MGAMFNRIALEVAIRFWILREVEEPRFKDAMVFLRKNGGPGDSLKACRLAAMMVQFPGYVMSGNFDECEDDQRDAP